MTYDLASPGHAAAAGPVPETSEYRLTHFRVYDEDGFAGSFASGGPGGATLEGVAAYLCGKFDGAKGDGFGSKDLVILHGARIVAVVLRGPEGRPEVTTFRAPEAGARPAPAASGWRLEIRAGAPASPDPPAHRPP